MFHCIIWWIYSANAYHDYYSQYCSGKKTVLWLSVLGTHNCHGITEQPLKVDKIQHCKVGSFMDGPRVNW